MANLFFGSIKSLVKRSSEKGQIVVEYVLLLVIAVTIAMLLTRLVVSRNPESPGFLISKWKSIIIAIGADPADDVAPAGD